MSGLLCMLRMLCHMSCMLCCLPGSQQALGLFECACGACSCAACYIGCCVAGAAVLLQYMHCTVCTQLHCFLALVCA